MTNPNIQQLIQTITETSTSSIDTEDTYNALLTSGETAILALLDAVQDKSHDQHHTLASVLCDILVDVGDEDALGMLRELVNHPNNAIFTPAARAVARFQTTDINTVLCDLLDHHAVQVRRVAAWQLGRNRATHMTNCLLKQIDNEEDIETLRGIIWSLGHIGDHRTRRRLEPFKDHHSDDVVVIAREAIQRIQDKSLNLPFK